MSSKNPAIPLKSLSDTELLTLREEINQELVVRENKRKSEQREKEERERGKSLDVFDLPLSAKLYNILRNNQIKNLGQLQAWRREDFITRNKISPADIEKLDRLMNQFNIAFKD